MLDKDFGQVAQIATDVPQDFVALVRDALAHLYDYAHLQRHPLAQLAAGPVCPLRDPADAVRQLLLEALEQLNPGPAVSRNDKEWRPYGVLVRRYVDGIPTTAIGSEMHMSRRQVQREHYKGLLALADMLWRKAGHQGPHGSEAASPKGSELQQEVSRLGLALQTCDLGLLVDAILGPARAVARSYGVDLATIPPRHPVIARVDLTLAKQVLLGALSAIMPGGCRRIEILWAVEQRQATITIRAQPPLPDDASGQARERRERLAEAEDLMRAQGGELRLNHDERGVAGVAVSFRPAEGSHVLLIDDNESILRLYERYLTATGFRVSCAADAAAALAAVEREAPEAIVLDIMMRETDGWQLLQRLRADPQLKSVPVIICSVLREPEIALALGAQCYLKKPVSQQQILVALQGALGRSSPAAPRPAPR